MTGLGEEIHEETAPPKFMRPRLEILDKLAWLSHYPSLIVSGISHGAIKEIIELERQVIIMREALDGIASWSDGVDVFNADGTSHFCEPHAAIKARRAIYKCEEVEE